MRAALEALLIVGGSLALFRFTWSGWVNLRRKQRAAERAERRADDAWLDDQIHHH